LFKEHLFITKEEFNFILGDIREIRTFNLPLLMSFENKVLMTLLFVVQCKGGKNLALIFNCSQYYVTKILDEMLHILVEYFVHYIPNKLQSHTRSRLHPLIRCVVDNTIHKTRKPMVKQRLYYNGHYKMQGRLTQLLSDFDGYIVGFLTNIPGKIYDSLSGIYNKVFPRILEKYFCIGDSGFNGVQFVVPGFQNCNVNSPSRRIFDKISRKEQIIENVNKFFKDCRSINKLDTFMHGDHRLLACIFIAVGFYNMKRSWGYYQPFESNRI
jgi:hypothetical protein